MEYYPVRRYWSLKGKRSVHWGNIANTIRAGTCALLLFANTSQAEDRGDGGNQELPKISDLCINGDITLDEVRTSYEACVANYRAIDEESKKIKNERALYQSKLAAEYFLRVDNLREPAAEMKDTLEKLNTVDSAAGFSTLKAFIFAESVLLLSKKVNHFNSSKTSSILSNAISESIASYDKFSNSEKQDSNNPGMFFDREAACKIVDLVGTDANNASPFDQNTLTKCLTLTDAIGLEEGEKFCGSVTSANLSTKACDADVALKNFPTYEDFFSKSQLLQAEKDGAFTTEQQLVDLFRRLGGNGDFPCTLKYLSEGDQICEGEDGIEGWTHKVDATSEQINTLQSRLDKLGDPLSPEPDSIIKKRKDDLKDLLSAAGQTGASSGQVLLTGVVNILDAHFVPRWAKGAKQAGCDATDDLEIFCEWQSSSLTYCVRLENGRPTGVVHNNSGKKCTDWNPEKNTTHIAANPSERLFNSRKTTVNERQFCSLQGVNHLQFCGGRDLASFAERQLVVNYNCNDSSSEATGRAIIREQENMLLNCVNNEPPAKHRNALKLGTECKQMFKELLLQAEQKLKKLKTVKKVRKSRIRGKLPAECRWLVFL